MTTSDEIKTIIEESERRSEGASKGPWIAQQSIAGNPVGWRIHIREDSSFQVARGMDDCDALFAAAARTALPARDKAIMTDREFIAEIRKWAERIEVPMLVIQIDEHEAQILAILKEGK